jgi:AcrR family transcriptional regulator
MAIEIGAEPGRRERKRLQTHDALRDAAIRLFLRKGFDATTVEDITEAVDVSPRTFFRHYASKEDVVFGGHEVQFELLGQALANRPDDEPVLASVREAILSLADVLEAERGRIFVQAQLVATSPALAARSVQVRDRLSDVVANHVARRLDVDRTVDVRPAVVSGAVVGALGAAIDTWVTSGAEGRLAGRVSQALELLDQGFGLDP